MQKFDDATGREWQINITVAEIERIRDQFGIDLSKLFDGGMKLLETLCDDVLTLAKVLAVLVAAEADRAAFIAAFHGDAIDRAVNALLQAVIDFFPNPKRREILRETIRKSWAAVDQAADKVTEKLQQLDSTQLASVINSAELSESIPAP